MILAVGWLAGIATAAVGRRRRPGAPAVLEPMCGCGHHKAFHNADGCNAAVEVESAWNSFGEAIQWERAPCACTGFVLSDDMMAALGVST